MPTTTTEKNHPLSPQLQARVGFKMNEKRDILFRQRFIDLECRGIERIAKREFDMAALYFGDLSDMLDVFHYLLRGDVDRATELWKKLDTAARDKYPHFICELAGWKLLRPDPEETLEGTK